MSDDLRDAWDRLRETAVAFGEQRIYASGTAIMFSRESSYFFVRPRRSFLQVCVFLGRAVRAPQVRRIERKSTSSSCISSISGTETKWSRRSRIGCGKPTIFLPSWPRTERNHHSARNPKRSVRGPVDDIDRSGRPTTRCVTENRMKAVLRSLSGGTARPSLGESRSRNGISVAA